MMGWYGNGSGYGWGWMVLMMAIPLALLVVAIWAVARTTRTPPNTTAPETPRQVLDRRLAMGEIDAEQYAAARHLIEARGSIVPPRGA